MAYWLGNTMLNPATLIFMGFVLGWKWTALRSAVGVALVFGIAHLGNRFVRPEDVPSEAHNRLAALDVGQGVGVSILLRWLQALWHLCIGIIPEFVVLIFILGAARAWLFPALNPAVGNSLWLLPAVALVGTLFVIPTAGEIPIVQTLMTYGMGAGPAGALLSTLPAVSLPSLLMVSRHFPARVLIFVTASVWPVFRQQLLGFNVCAVRRCAK
jgi:uncharacterized membrane protein YraQ (UPF0718 family)